MRHRLGLAVVAGGIGLAAATVTGHGVAWAETPHSDPASQSTTGPSASDGPRHFHLGALARAARTSQTPSSAGQTSPAAEKPAADYATAQADSIAPQQESPVDPLGGFFRALGQARSGLTIPAGAVRSRPAPLGQSFDTRTRPTTSARLSVVTAAVDAATQRATQPSTPTATFAAATASITESATTPAPPRPLSPIEKLEAAPGRIVNAVLQALDITASSNGPKSPLNFAPIDEALFAAFRRVEGAFGLDETPADQPPLLHETYTGPTTGQTPTVEQFLNAAAAEYVLGGTPAGLKPFTVDGKQMTSRNVLSGESAQAWVTPEGQIIVAYQGTTGGTNLLFHPVIAVTQLATDVQIIFTDTTPQAFTDSLAFERQVEAEAVKQGYSTSDIFVTGHSLGGWEAEYVAQQTPGMSGIGFESPGINTTVDGNGVDSGFVNIETFGDTAAYFSTDLPGLQPFMPAYVPGGGSKPHYGSIIMIGDPEAVYPLQNASALWGTSLVGDVVFAVDILGNFFEHHLPGMQAYNLDVSPDPGVVPWLGSTMGDINDDWGGLTIPELEAAASATGVLITP